MPQGMEVYDAAGNLIWGTSSSLGRVLGVATISGSATGVITDPAYLATSRAFWTILPDGETGAPTINNYDTPVLDYAPFASPAPGITYSPGYATSGKNYKIVYGVF